MRPVLSDTESPEDLLYRAYNSPFGVAIETEDLDRFRQRLYLARKRDPDLLCISICVAPDNPTTGLWLVKKGTADAPRPETD